MMKCPYCVNEDTKVVDSRALEENTAVRRRRLCEKCGERFTTYERIDNIPLVVTKRNGIRESFDRDKLLNGIIKSCNKRPVAMHQMERIVTDIEAAVHNSLKREIESREIGEMVMTALQKTDEVAYVRFASVYKQFKDVDTFMHELSKIMQSRTKD